MNERSEQFKRFVEKRMATKSYRRHVRWLRIYLWFWGLFHPKEETTRSTEDIDMVEELYGDFHEECGDR